MKELAFIFPGQGSQKVGMDSAFSGHPLHREYFDKASEKLGFDLLKLCAEGPAEDLTLTENAQPAILTVSFVAFKIFSESHPGVSPKFLAGHSLGEYTALCAAGSIDFREAVLAVHRRGQFMQEQAVSGTGAMAAILGKSAEEVERICDEESKGEEDSVRPANYNCPGQVVVSGKKEAVDRVLERVKGMKLDVSAPFHSAHMAPAGEKLAGLFSAIEFKSPKFPVIANFDAAPLTEASQIAPSLIRQISGAVRWEASIRHMIENGAERFVEFGSGKILTGLMKRIDRAKTVYNVDSPESATLFNPNQ